MPDQLLLHTQGLNLSQSTSPGFTNELGSLAGCTVLLRYGRGQASHANAVLHFREKSTFCVLLPPSSHSAGGLFNYFSNNCLGNYPARSVPPGGASLRGRGFGINSVAHQHGVGLGHVALNVHHQEFQLVGKAQQQQRKHGVGNEHGVGIYLAGQQHQA